MVDVVIQTRPRAGQSHCGDQGAYWRLSAEQLLVCLADGIGHGQPAFEAASRCLTIVEKCRFESLAVILAHCNEALRVTRGVAAALCKWDVNRAQLEFAGVGNITAVKIGNHLTYLPSLRGILGAEQNLQVRTRVLPLTQGQDMFFMGSDGMSEALPYMQYRRQLLFPDLSAMVSELLLKWGSAADDSAVLVAR